MTSAKRLFFAVLLSAMAFAAQGAATKNVFKGENSFTREGVTYRLTWTARGTTTSFMEKESTKVSYSVRIGDQFLHPRTLRGGTVIGCWNVPPAKVRWQPLGDPQLGWLLLLGTDCELVHGSHKVLLIVPRVAKYRGSTDYVSAVFVAKSKPVARWSQDGKRLRVWSSYQQWSRRRKGRLFFVPEMREFFAGVWNKSMMACPVLPADVRQWPGDLPNRSFLGDFYAGILRFDAEIMQSALENYRDINFKTLRYHDLPGDRKGLEKMIQEFRRLGNGIAELRASLDGFWLPWGNGEDRCKKHFNWRSRMPTSSSSILRQKNDGAAAAAPSRARFSNFSRSIVFTKSLVGISATTIAKYYFG